jgi:hypothetical protein
MLYPNFWTFILDFYHRNSTEKDMKLRYVVFDSKFTSYENPGRMDEDKINFITIRRRGKLMLERIARLPKKGWKKVKVESAVVISNDFEMTVEKVVRNYARHC